MKKEITNVVLMLMVVLMVTMVGCISSADLQFLRAPENLKNHALQENGAGVTASRGTGSYYSFSQFQENPQHPVENLINGNSSSENWIQGEGWECRYQCDQLGNYSYYYYRGEAGSIAEVVVDFPRETRLNRVVVHTIDNEEYPALQYGVCDLGVRYLVGNDVWAPVDLQGGRERFKGRIQKNCEAVMDFRFKSVMTRAIKLLVFDTNDSIGLSTYAYRRAKKGTVRLVEIEAYGIEKVAGSSEIAGSSDADFDQLFGKTDEIDFSYEGVRSESRQPLRLGVRGHEISANIAEQLGLVSDHGILLLELAENSPAAEKRSEIKIGNHKTIYQGVEYPVDSDILVDIDGSEIREAGDIRRILATKKAGDTIELGIVSSSGQRKNVFIDSDSGAGNQSYSADISTLELIETSRPKQTDSGNKVAPDFVLRDMDGEQVSITDFKGKVVILDFWATWCPPCVKEIPHFVELYREYKEQGFVMLGISVDRSARVVEPFIQQNQVNYPILMADSRVKRVYGGVRSIPTTFVIDKTGRIRREYVGYRDKSIFETDLMMLLAED